MNYNSERKNRVPSMEALWAHRRLVFSLVLCLVVALGVVVALRTFGPGSALGSTLSVSPTASPTPALHETYAFSFEIMLLDAAAVIPVLHVGQPVTFQWTPVPNISVPNGEHAPTANRSFPVHCTLALYGPYPSLADLSKATSAPATGDGIAPPGTPPAFTTPPLNMTDWDTMPHQVEMVLPTTLHAGYYQADNECLSERDQSTSGLGYPIQIAP